MKMRQATIERMKFIESILFWEGRIGRTDMMKALEISQAQATLEFKRYRKIAPNNIQFDVSLKCYTPSSKFKPKYYKPDPYEYLSNLKSFNEKSIDNSNPSRFENVEILKICINTSILKDITVAMNKNHIIHIKYQGMNDNAKGREIYPTSLFFDGIRWQIRAYCFEKEAYRTFTLSRISKIIQSEKTDKEIPDDIEWCTMINVIIIPNSKRSKEQQETISYELGMVQNEKKIEVRKNLLPYFLLANRLYPLDSDGNIAIKNKKEVEKAIEGKPIDMFR